MNTAGPVDWRRTSPFAVVFFIGTTVKLVARGFMQAALPMIGAFIVLRDEPAAVRILLYIAGGGLLLILPVAVLKWMCFRFRIEEDRLLIREGILKKSSLDLPFERVQGINVERSLVDRILGLVTVSLDSAGSVQAEGKLPSVTTELADDLRARVAALRMKLAGASDDGAAQAEGTSAAEAVAIVGAPVAQQPGVVEGAGEPGVFDARVRKVSPAPMVSRGKVLLKLGAGDMVRIGLASRNFLFVAALVGVVSDLLQPGDLIDPVLEAIATGVDNAADALGNLGALARVAAIATVIFAMLAVAVTVTVAAAFLRHHGFTLWHDGLVFRSRAGLVTQREVVVEGGKIQQLTLSQSLVLRWFRRFRLRALPAAVLVQEAGGAAPPGFDAAQVLDIPLIAGGPARDMRSRVFAAEAPGVPLLPRDGSFQRVSTYYIRGLMLKTVLVWGLVAAWILFFVSLVSAVNGSGVVPGWGVLLALGVWLSSIPVAALMAWQRWRRQAYAHDDEGLAVRSGLVGSRVDAFLMRKVQSAIVKQSPLQRRRRLATLVVHLACGKVTVPCIDYRAACRLRDYILYKVESGRRRWH